VLDECKRENQHVVCPNCKQVVPEAKLKDYWALRDRVLDVVYRNSTGHPGAHVTHTGPCLCLSLDPMEQSFDFLKDMEALFDPCQKIYLTILECVYERYIDEEVLLAPSYSLLTLFL